MEQTGNIRYIIDRRKGQGAFAGKGHIDEVRTRRKHLEKVLGMLQDYADFRQQVLAQIAAGAGEYYHMAVENPLLAEQVEAAAPDAAIAKVLEAIDALRLLETRFGRDSINVSVIGRARQGKSRLLQAVSGLPDEVIPAANGGDCTGAKSVIVNATGDTRAEVDFYTEVEMVEQVQRYLDSLHIARKLGSASQIPGLKADLDTYAATLGQRSATEQSLYGHLRKYVKHYEEYRKHIGTTVPVDHAADIRGYVAQYDAAGKDTYLYLGVREVRIYTRFPAQGADDLVLVDTIGLGDTSLGIREKMLRTLREDSDAAIMVRLPAATGDGWRVEDNDLYDLIREAMGKEGGLDKWLFMVLNVSDTLGNRAAGAAMAKTLAEKKLACAFVAEADCAAPADVEKRLLGPVLKYLGDHLAEVDTAKMAQAGRVCADAHALCFELFGRVGNLLNNSLKQSLHTSTLFYQLFRHELQLSPALKALNDKYADRTAKSAEIEHEVKRVIRHIADHCPAQADIEKRLNTGGHEGHVENVYNHFADNLRAAVRDDFEELNSSVITSMQEGVKGEIVHTLRCDEGGRMGRIPLCADTGDSPAAWLESLIAEKLQGNEPLHTALTDVLTYRLNIEGLLEYKVNCALDCLDQTSPNFRRLPQRVYGLDTPAQAQLISQMLMAAIPVVANALLAGIQELLCIPYNSFNARIRKLRERLFFSEAGNMALMAFYSENATALWPDRYKEAISQEAALGLWNDYHSRLADCCRKELFTLRLTDSPTP